MNDKLQNVLATLAEKLGTTVPYLWNILIKQARINAIECIFVVLLALSGAILLYTAHKRLSKPSKIWPGKNMYCEKEPVNVIMIVALIIQIIVMVWAVSCVGDMLDCWLNPQYWALKQILESVK